MGVTVVTLTEDWKEVLTGPGIVQVAEELEGADPAVYSELATEPEFEKIFVATGSSAPTDDYDYLECTKAIEFNLATNLYLRTHRGTRVVKVLQF